MPCFGTIKNSNGKHLFSLPQKYNQIQEDDTFNLVVTNVTMNDIAYYTCFISNDIGNTSSGAWLIVVPGK